MKRILLALILLVWALPVQAQTTTKLCFPVVVTGQNKMSCQDVSFPNPLPVTGINLSVGSLNISAASAVSATITNTTLPPGNVTVTNTATSPAIVSVVNAIQNNPMQVTVTNNGPFNVTVTNTATAPAIVTCTNCGAASVTGPFNVTVTNTATNPAIVSVANSISATATGPFNVTVTNVASAPAIVTCTNCGAATVTGPFNVTITNTATSPAIVSAPNGFAASSSGPFNVTVTNVASAPVNVSVVNAIAQILRTDGGWTTVTASNLLTTVAAVKTSNGQLGKVYCYNPNSSVAYLQVFNLTTGAVTLGTSKPAQIFGIPATNAGGYSLGPPGDQYSTAISVAATTTPTGLTQPSTGLECSFSTNN